ncbi:MAG: DUF5119 domain-containing protein [Muribaculaceae bacterium]|nr:DUF5119 domain-containing protein [Muribaculaceae bacterium]
MKGKNKIVLGAVLLSSAGSVLTSCHHKELVYPDASRTRLEVVFDWCNAPEADPSSMAFYLYDRNGGSPVRFIFQNKEGGSIHVPAGDYFAMCLNADLTDWAVIEREDAIDAYKVSTLDATQLTAMGISTRGIPRAPESETERMASTPGMLWSFRRDDVSLPVTYERMKIVMYPEEKVCHYTVDVYTTDDIAEYSGGVDATLSGMAEGYMTGAEKTTEEKVTHPFHLLPDASDGCLRSEFLTFGETPSGGKHYVSIYMIDSEGKGRNFNVDVTDQVSKAPDPRHVHIVIHRIDLPEPHTEQTGMGGLQPDVENWESVNITLHM